MQSAPVRSRLSRGGERQLVVARVEVQGELLVADLEPVRPPSGTEVSDRHAR